MGVSRHIAVSWLILSLSACSSNPPAPVIDRLPTSKSSTVNKPNSRNKSSHKTGDLKAGDWRPDTYIVKKGDTLYSIGLEHGYDYKEIAQANDIAAPYTIKVGQALKFSSLKDKPTTAENKVTPSNNDGVTITPIKSEPSTTGIVTTVIAISEPKAIREPYSEEALKRTQPTVKLIPTTSLGTASKADTEVKSPEVKPEPQPEAKPDAEAKPNAESPEDMDWAWPTKGKVIANFNEAGNKGIDIAGSNGQAVNAAAAGKVIYSGSDLRGYGKLVIIKHNPTYLSVYAHNSLILIKEGQQVSRGQKIAEMGNTDSNAVKLHFEIRRQGKSVDPSKYLTTN